ncbi:MAG: hypothetical protein AB1540_14880 [Bdellovibrionota bacterium]
MVKWLLLLQLYFLNLAFGSEKAVVDASQFLAWPPEKVHSWKQSTSMQSQFPRSKSARLESFLSQFGDAFRAMLPLPEKLRLHFDVLDTVNPTFWPFGHGFIVMHSGLILRIHDLNSFLFLLALESAHDVLGHVQNRVQDLKWQAFPLRIDLWTSLVGRDPLAHVGVRAYTVSEEAEALEIVYRFLRAYGIDPAHAGMELVSRFEKINALPEMSSVPVLHRNLKTALSTSVLQSKPAALKTFDALISEPSFAEILKELGQSKNQLQAWMVELIPYAYLLKKEGESFEEDQRLAQAVKARLKRRSEKGEARLAWLYVQNLMHLRHRQWRALLKNSTEALSIGPSAIPFRWHKGMAHQQLRQFNHCIHSLGESWGIYDFRRLLLELQCSFLEGRYTDAARLANQFRQKHPYDAEGAFWQALNAIRIRQPIDQLLAEMDNYWGDRPFVRALKVLHFGYIGKLTDAKAIANFSADAAFSDEEWGKLHMAEAWLYETFIFKEKRPRFARSRREKSEQEWVLAGLVRENLPRETIQIR